MTFSSRSGVGTEFIVILTTCLTSAALSQTLIGNILSKSNFCAAHGGKSTGAKTTDGKRRCAAAKTIHGRETRAIRNARSEKLAELRQLETQMVEMGILRGNRTPGRKPKLQREKPH
tara:strand:+ start:19 stop:369 length:351 start_codon:yes stop_codon:yes gene_type:complete